MITDFSLSNPLIKSYFDGSDEYVPTNEFLYLHTHPLIRPNFLEQIEVKIRETTEYCIARSINSTALMNVALLAEKLGKILPIVTEENAQEALSVLREIYRFCKRLTGTE